jgi:hypothetical protein
VPPLTSSWLRQPTWPPDTSRNFEFGAIYWSEATGAHEVNGEIGKKYQLLGGPSYVVGPNVAPIGYPINDEHDALDHQAVQLTSKDHDGEGDFVPVGAGAWDHGHRPSWVNLDWVIRVHESGMRREAAALPREPFEWVAHRLHQRYGWR